MYLLQRPRFTLIKLIAITRLLSPCPLPLLRRFDPAQTLCSFQRRSPLSIGCNVSSLNALASPRKFCTVSQNGHGMASPIARRDCTSIENCLVANVKWGRGVKRTINNTRLVTCVTALVFPARFVSREIFRKEENFFFFLDGWKTFFKVAYLKFFFSVQFQFSSIKFVLH